VWHFLASYGRWMETIILESAPFPIICLVAMGEMAPSILFASLYKYI
jgi:hypothetical protein